MVTVVTHVDMIDFLVKIYTSKTQPYTWAVTKTSMMNFFFDGINLGYFGFENRSLGRTLLEYMDFYLDLTTLQCFF